MRLWLAIAGVLGVGCGGISTMTSAPCADAGANSSSEPDAHIEGVTPNPACIETDESLAACARTESPASWTAPGTCMVESEPGSPQKRLADGTVVERPGRKCCGFVRTEGVLALCCADFATCLGAGDD